MSQQVSIEVKGVYGMAGVRDTALLRAVPRCQDLVLLRSAVTLVEHKTLNLRVMGSCPTLGTNLLAYKRVPQWSPE